MLIYHGEDQINSRNAFLQNKIKVRSQNLQVQDLPADTLTLPNLRSVVETDSLFGQANAVFIDSLFTRRPSNEKKLVIDYLNQNPDKEIYLWESKDVSSQLNGISPQIIRKFDLPKYIFTFLDNLDLESFHRCREALPPEQLLASISTRIHKVLLGQGKFNHKFTLDQLKNMNQTLLEIDYAQKTSTSPFDLSSALELWLVKNVHS